MLHTRQLVFNVCHTSTSSALKWNTKIKVHAIGGQQRHAKAFGTKSSINLTNLIIKKKEKLLEFSVLRKAKSTEIFYKEWQNNEGKVHF